MLRTEFDMYLKWAADDLGVDKPDYDLDDYKLIENVYTYHPLFDSIKYAKKAAALLYVIGGRNLFADLTPEAEAEKIKETKRIERRLS